MSRLLDRNASPQVPAEAAGWAAPPHTAWSPTPGPRAASHRDPDASELLIRSRRRGRRMLMAGAGCTVLLFVLAALGGSQAPDAQGNTADPWWLVVPLTLTFVLAPVLLVAGGILVRATRQRSRILCPTPGSPIVSAPQWRPVTYDLITAWTASRYDRRGLNRHFVRIHENGTSTVLRVSGRPSSRAHDHDVARNRPGEIVGDTSKEIVLRDVDGQALLFAKRTAAHRRFHIPDETPTVLPSTPGVEPSLTGIEEYDAGPATLLEAVEELEAAPASDPATRRVWRKAVGWSVLSIGFMSVLAVSAIVQRDVKLIALPLLLCVWNALLIVRLWRVRRRNHTEPRHF